jgi:putative ABC transport system permease protein
MLGTAIICTSFIVGDTYGQSIRNIAPAKLGEVDIDVSANKPEQLVPAIAAADAGSLKGIDGSLTLYSIGATVATPGSDPGRLAEPFSTILELDFDAARHFGSDVGNTGFADAGATPAGNEVVLGEDLAHKLDVAAGDAVDVHAYGTVRSVVVRGIVPRRGLAGFGGGEGTNAYTAFLPPGTIDGMRAEGKAPTAAPPTAAWVLSADGGVFDGEPNARPIFHELEHRLHGMDGIAVRDAKHLLLQNADLQSASIRQLFTGIGGFSVIAGILLLVNIFVMLAEERKAELGVLRAVGLKRNHLVRTFGIEGALYAAMAALVGGIVGIGIARGISTIAANIQRSAFEEYSLRMTFTVHPASVITAMLVGLIISMITIWGTSLRIGRLNIIRAIREQADPARDPRSRRAMVFAILGVVLGVLMLQSGIASKQAPPTSLGPAIVLFSTMVLLRRRVRERFALSIPAALIVLYEMNAFAFFPQAYRDPAIATFVIQGVTTSAAAVVLAAANADLIASAAERIAGSALAARLGVAYPLARRFRTGLLLAMYSLIIFTLTFMATLAHTFQAQTPRVADRMRGGFDLFVGSSWTNPVSAEQIAAEPGVATVAPLRRGQVKFATDWVDEPAWWSVSGFDQHLLDGGAPALRSTFQGMSSDDAWKLALQGSFTQADGTPMTFHKADGSPFLVDAIPAIVPNFFLTNGNGPPRQAPDAGLLFDIVDPVSNRHQKLLAVGIVEGDWVGNGVFVNDAFLDHFVSPTVVARYLVKAAPDADPVAVADRITADLIPNGANARTFQEMVAIGTSTQVGFFRLVQGYLGLGLLVGVAGLGVVMVRAVRERRRQIGMLRAMGFQASVVRRAFLLEATFIASQGVVIGIVLGLLTSWSVMTNSDSFSANSIRFEVPWLTVALLVVVPMGASLLGVLAPARSASRIRPAVALRIAD